MPDFFPERGGFQEKSAGILAGFRAFLTQKATAIGEKDDVYIFQTSPSYFGINRAEWRGNGPKGYRRYRSGSWRRLSRAAGSLRSRFAADTNAGKARKPLFRW